MKKFFSYSILVLAILGALFAYVLYTEGVFDATEPVKQEELKPFMKCETGKCGEGKCGTN